MDSSDDETLGELQTTCVVREGNVGDTTNPPTVKVVDPIRGDTLKDHNSDGVWYGGEAGETAISPIMMSGEGKCRGEAGETAFSSVMLSDIEKVNSPATSTPGSTTSPTG